METHYGTFGPKFNMVIFDQNCRFRSIFWLCHVLWVELFWTQTFVKKSAAQHEGGVYFENQLEVILHWKSLFIEYF